MSRSWQRAICFGLGHGSECPGLSSGVNLIVISTVYSSYHHRQAVCC